MIIAVDFDGTLQDTHGKPNLSLIQRLKLSQQRGDTVVLWTCRENKKLLDALAFLRKNNFYPNFVNCNCPEGIKKLGHDSRKIYADVYIDDKSINIRPEP